MNHATAFAAGLLLCTLSACEVNINTKEADSRSTETGSSESVQAPGTGAGEGFSPEAEARARQLAIQSGAERQRTRERREARRHLENLRFEVDISDRKLRVLQGEDVMGTHDVAVGTEKWPTPTGSWAIHRVDLNPEWNPPINEEWAKDEVTQPPGSENNPMGRARLVYRMPNTIHGTEDISSLGKASSHGSIRVANDVAIQLAEMLLKAGESWEGQQWFEQMAQNSSEEYQVRLEQPIPIEVQE